MNVIYGLTVAELWVKLFHIQLVLPGFEAYADHGR